MIKFFQKLKAKKGFTLVELIVVIAIIGVLAAILVPTMLGYVTSSRVTSVNSTAASIKNNIDNFLTACDTAGYGMLKGTTNTATITIEVTAGSWVVTNDTIGSFKNGNGKTWAGSGTGTASQTKVGESAPETLLAIELADLFPEIETGYIAAWLEGGKCLACYYTPDTNAAPTAMLGFQAGGWAAGQSGTVGVYEWDNSTAGVNSEGFIIGTAPVVALG